TYSFFFFSSRRRHTRSYGDWSSDVCSSDLATSAFQVLTAGYAQKFDPNQGWIQVTGAKAMQTTRGKIAVRGTRRERRARQWKNRSEERRVGKECRARGWRDG